MVRRMRKILTNQQEPGETAYREDALQMWRRHVEPIWIDIAVPVETKTMQYFVTIGKLVYI